MSARTTDNIIKIADTGVSLSVTAEGRTTDNLVRIAETVRKAGGQLTVTNTGKLTTDNLIRLAKAGLGSITIEV